MTATGGSCHEIHHLSTKYTSWYLVKKINPPMIDKNSHQCVFSRHIHRIIKAHEQIKQSVYVLFWLYKDFFQSFSVSNATGRNEKNLSNDSLSSHCKGGITFELSIVFDNFLFSVFLYNEQASSLPPSEYCERLTLFRSLGFTSLVSLQYDC